MRSLRFDQFRVVTEQRREFVERVKALQPDVLNRAIADALGVDHQTINNDTRGENSPSSQRDTEENQEEAGEKSPPEPPYVEGFAPDEPPVDAGEAAKRENVLRAIESATRSRPGRGLAGTEDAA